MAEPLVYGIDVGTTKIVAIAGRADTNSGLVEVLSMGEAPSRGLKRGVVVDREATAESISRALRRCEVQGGPVSVGIAGSHISSVNTEVTLLNRSRNLTITEDFVQQLEEEARLASADEDMRVLHVVPREYVLDGSGGVKRPVGLAARRVTMRAHVVSGAVASIQNLLSAVEDCGVEVSQVVLEPLASAEACLSEKDREEGICLVDVGGGTTDIAVFHRGALSHTTVIPIGGESFSSDVAYGMKIPFDAAERLKVRYGSVLSRTVDPVAAVKLGDRYYNAHFLSEILEYRAREVFEYTRDSLEKFQVKNLLPGGVVLTGGGSLLEGMTELCEEVLRIRTANTAPSRVKGELKAVQKPQYATTIGLLHFSSQNDNRLPEGEGATKFSFGSIVAAIKSWFRGE